MGSGGKDAAVQVFLDIEEVGNLVVKHAPLIVSEVVNDYQEYFLAVVQVGEDAVFEDVGAHDGALVGPAHPADVVFTDELGELCVGFCALHVQHFLHGAVCLGELQLPIGKPFVNFYPFVQRQRVVDLHAYLAEVLLVGACLLLGHYLLLVQVLLQGKQNLCGVDGLYQVIGNLGPDGLLHDILLLALGDHDYGHTGGLLLDAVQCLQSVQAGHVLIQQNEVEGLFCATVQGIIAVGHGFYDIPFFLQIQDMCFQQLYLVIYPKQSVCSHIIILIL